METKITRQQLITVAEALTELIDNWNDDAMDEDRGRDNNALCLLIWDDGSGQLGTQWGDVFNKQMEFDNAEELADALAPWLGFVKDKLQGEVERLQTGLSAVEARWREASQDKCFRSHFRQTMEECADELRALLNGVDDSDVQAEIDKAFAEGEL